MRKQTIHRRTLLKAGASSIALPLLETMLNSSNKAHAQEIKPPKRFIGGFMSNGVIMDLYRLATGHLHELDLPPTLKVFEDLKESLLAVQGLTGINTSKHRLMGLDSTTTQSYLRAAHYGHLSVDQLAHVAHMKSPDRTRFGSLAINANSTCGARDSDGRPQSLCATSWEGPGDKDYKTRISDPRFLFHMLFGTTAPLEASADTGSILDNVLEQKYHLNQQLGFVDQTRLDLHLTKIRELEIRLNSIDIRNRYSQLRAFSDLIVLAFECDLARYISYMFENGNDYTFLNLPGVSDAHGPLTDYSFQHQEDSSLHRLELFFYAQWAYLIRELRNSVDLTGNNLLDSCFTCFSNQYSNSYVHTNKDLPFLAAGSCNGFFKTGKSIDVSEGTDLGNIWVSVLQALGFPRHDNRVGFSEGPALELHLV